MAQRRSFWHIADGQVSFFSSGLCPIEMVSFRRLSATFFRDQQRRW